MTHNDNNTGELTHSQLARKMANHIKYAHMLIARYGHRLMYVEELGWFYWSGTHWKAGERGIRFASKMIEQEMLKARDMPEEGKDDAETKAMLARKQKAITELSRMSTAPNLRGILSVAREQPALIRNADELDAQPHLLNTPNGTLDLRTLEIKDHEPADLLTKITAGNYVADLTVEGSKWDEFLHQVLPGEDVIEYLLQVCGVALMGEVVEQILVILLGRGRNGKGVFALSILNTVGDYGIQLETDLLMKKDTKAHTTGEADLKGARVGISSESESGKYLNESLVKRFTGGNRRRARKLYKDNMEWDPSDSLFLETNHLPQVVGVEAAMWDRLKVIEFPRYFSAEERDPGLANKLKGEADVILTSLVNAYHRYRNAGHLVEPHAVTKRVNKWRREANPVLRFIEERCDQSKASKVLLKELYPKWIDWCAEADEEVRSDKWLTKILDDMGYPSRRTKNGALHAGLTLKE
ncbi:hypothetical protein HUN08_01845 [Gordonia sp. X0973]|uniref:DNA primase family protein n=1 Tax=Gordonia sp. X0973 TaxID=2742602 RepID=UPI0013E9EBBE|nr:phage/plasmid primase, P4 family [Gordonia sp. X0973]QKT06072.1 hypothetical protein HUN08_01845 [Gordonia sp. X0973]